MNYILNKDAYKEQLQFIKTFCEKFGDTLNFYGLNINGYICNPEGRINASRLLSEFIDDGKLNNWINDELENKRVQSSDEMNIFYFMKSYYINSYVNSIGGSYKTDNTLAQKLGIEQFSFTIEELMKLDSIHEGYCFENSLVDFYESHDDNDNGETIFSYDESRKFM